MGRGRKGKYEADVKPRFDEIAEWCKLGMADKEICENLGLSQSAFYDYKAKHSEFAELVKNARKQPVLLIKSALLKRAIGFSYSEKKIITNENGETRTEEYIKQALPDPASAMILLKHWAKDEGWTNDPAALALRKREIELKEKQAENESW